MENHSGRPSPPLPPAAKAPVEERGVNGVAEGRAETSYVARVEAPPGTDPFALFDEWRALAAARSALMVNTMVLATVNSKLEVSARTVVLRRLDGEAFVFMTDARSRKASDLAEHPAASVVFQWNYREGQRVVNRQVRAGGAVEPLPEELFGDLYSREPLYCRVRSHLCHQGARVDWAAHAATHDALLEQHLGGRGALHERPDHVVAYRLLPDWLEVYHALDDCIGDRVLFTRAAGGGWSAQHLAA